MTTLHFLIEGKVQGVFFRVSAKRKADDLGITGWIKNTPNGHVEALATGEEVALKAFEQWCRRGPEKAQVTQVTVTPRENNSSFTSFSIIR
ncbi:MAG: acylphosphatase [Ferruginibacter sp.]|nr:acylphosphatase [Ferruginibacter sp.]